ncbi:hypothetical protein A4X03_0g8936, partial [Tilletia caries]
MKLEFEFTSELHFKDANSFSAVNVQGGIYHRDTKGTRTQRATIEYEADSVSFGNPVVEYVKRLGGSSQGPTPLENGCSINPPSTSSSFVAPASNEAYSLTSGDFN